MIISYLLTYSSQYKTKLLIISVFHSVPSVPRVKMERFAGLDAQTYASLNAVGEGLEVR